VPEQDWTENWSDTLLYQKYGITEEEVLFINSLIRPMGSDDE